ncbi:MAG: hypothetical protein IPK04_16980 [Bdellovibrionales bacterium]|nr:hypothetical protein [Bdellovibrionales bacterium]
MKNLLVLLSLASNFSFAADRNYAGVIDESTLVRSTVCGQNQCALTIELDSQCAGFICIDDYLENPSNAEKIAKEDVLTACKELGGVAIGKVSVKTTEISNAKDDINGVRHSSTATVACTNVESVNDQLTGPGWY